MYQHLGWHFPSVDKHFVSHVGEYPSTTYQQATIDEASKYLKNFNCAIDVGANIGLHTVRFSKIFKSVHAFEPTSINYECLEKNTASLQNIHLNKFGLGATASRESIKLPIDSNNCGGFSIVDWQNHSQEFLEETIEIKTLDSLKLAPDLIKIDVQGFDLNVLMGGKNTLTKFKPVVIVEAESKKIKNEIRAFLTSLKFELATEVRKDQIWVQN